VSASSTALVKELKSAFQEEGDEAAAKQMAAYMKNKFNFYGVKRPERDVIQRRILDQYGYPPSDEIEDVATKLFEDVHRESQYAALDILRHEVKRGPNRYRLLRSFTPQQIARTTESSLLTEPL